MRRHDTFRAEATRLERGGRRARKANSERKGLARTGLSIDVLEDRRMMSVTTPVETVYRDLVSVEVVDRHVFYNNSVHDGNSAAIRRGRRRCDCQR